MGPNPGRRPLRRKPDSAPTLLRLLARRRWAAPVTQRGARNSAGNRTRGGIDETRFSLPTDFATTGRLPNCVANKRLAEFAEHVPITIVRPPCVFRPGDS